MTDEPRLTILIYVGVRKLNRWKLTTNKTQKKDTTMARPAFNRDTFVAEEIANLVAFGVDNEKASQIANAKADKKIKDAEDKAALAADNAKKIADQEIEDKKELTRVANLLVENVEVPSFLSRFVIATVAVKEEKEGKLVEVARRVSKVRLYFTQNDSAMEVNQLIKTYETEEEVSTAVEEAKKNLLSVFVK